MLRIDEKTILILAGKGFAGVTTDVAQLGEGIVNVLYGAAVVTIGDIVGFQEGVIDMWGEGAKWTPFSKTYNIVIDIKSSSFRIIRSVTTAG